MKNRKLEVLSKKDVLNENTFKELLESKGWFKNRDVENPKNLDEYSLDILECRCDILNYHLLGRIRELIKDSKSTSNDCELWEEFSVINEMVKDISENLYYYRVRNM